MLKNFLAVVIIGFGVWFTVDMVKDQEVHQPDQVQRQANEQAKTQDPKFLASPAGKIWSKHKDWPTDVCETIAHKEVNIGMTALQAQTSWGKPRQVNRTVTDNHTHEQWVYGDPLKGGTYLYFIDGRMTSFQDSK